MTWRRVLKWIGITALTLVISVTALIGQGLFRFDLMLTNPVITKIRARPDKRWGTLAELTPDVFAKGMTDDEASRILDDEGFVRVTEKTLWERHRAEFDRGDLIYMRDASMMVCKINAYVFLRFADDRTLVSAQGTVEEHGCL